LQDLASIRPARAASTFKKLADVDQPTFGDPDRQISGCQAREHEHPKSMSVKAGNDSYDGASLYRDDSVQILRHARAISPKETQRECSTWAAILLCFCVLSLAPPETWGQQPVAVLEKQAGEEVANLVQQARSQNKLPELERIEDPNLREEACARAQTGATSWNASSAVVVRNGAVTLSRISYSTPDAAHRVPELLSWAARNERGEPRRFAVGVCFVRPARDPEGRYWIEVLTYMGATKSLFYRTGLALAHLWAR